MREMILAGCAALFTVLALPAQAAESRFAVVRDDAKGTLKVMIDGREAFVYQGGKDVDLTHFYPLRSPSGRSMTVQQVDPYPHHRSFWFADTVELAGHRQASFYNALYSRADKDDVTSPFKDRIRHHEYLRVGSEGDVAELRMSLVWEMDGKTPVLQEIRDLRLVALGEGEWFMDAKFRLTAAYGDVKFMSDAVHYAWPFLRMSTEFSPDGGGKLVNSEGANGQKETHDKPARWVDYSNTIEGRTEGLALFVHPDSGPNPRWLTRDYGTFGPRRADAQSGKPFVVKEGQSLYQRVGVLVHTGDAKTGRVAERYEQYAKGKL